jgi:multidrug resistance protein MdtO
MGALAQSLPRSSSFLASLGPFLREELAPYRGRGILVTRIVVASTLVMILGMTFRIPGIVQAAIFTIFISRESLQKTASTAWTLIGSAAIATAYVLCGTMFALDSSLLRFAWVGLTLLLVFYVFSTLRNYTAAVGLAIVCVVPIPVLDSTMPQEWKVEQILWLAASFPIGTLVALAVDEVFAALGRTDGLREAINERMAAVEEVLRDYAEGREAPAGTRLTIQRLATVGTSGLQRMLRRSSYDEEHKERMGALIALAGKLVDLGANLVDFGVPAEEDERRRITSLVEETAELRDAVEKGRIPRASGLPGEPSPAYPMLAGIEKTLSLIRDIFIGAQSPAAFEPLAPRKRGRNPLFSSDALSNPEHLKFAIRGSLAAWLCYIIYNALFWPGISTSVLTCVLTALTTIGASHQKQLLRFAGALMGGVVLAMGAQVFILPGVDSIAAFTVLYAIVTAIAAWFATSSARLSYFGVQAALAFYLVHLQEFKFQTSLLVARDRVVGVFVGLAMMWFTFDLLWSSPAAVGMKKAFVSSIRLLAQFTREPASASGGAAIECSYALRAQINQQFNRARELADAVLFEFGPSRQRDLALRQCFREWQPLLRTLFLMRIASFNYRVQSPGFELPEAIRLWQREYDRRSADILDAIADRIEGQEGPGDLPKGPAGEELSVLRQGPGEQPSNLASLATLLGGINRVTDSLAEDVAKYSFASGR